MGHWRKLGSSLNAIIVVHVFFMSCVHRTTALEQLQELSPAPSVGMHDVPRESVGEHLGVDKDEEESRDELDERLARKS